jgi:hypothetical protein
MLNGMVKVNKLIELTAGQTQGIDQFGYAIQDPEGSLRLMLPHVSSGMPPSPSLVDSNPG